MLSWRRGSKTKGTPPRSIRRWGSLEQLEDRTVLSSTPIGIEQLINTTVAGDQRLVSIGSNPKATQSVVAWASANEDGSGDGIYAQRYDLFGGKVGAPFRVNTFTSGNQTSPAVAIDSLGGFVVAWQSAGQDGNGDGIYARRFNFDATPVAAEFRVNTTTTGNQQAPAVAMNDLGEFAVAFQSASRDSNGNAVVARVFRSTGTAVGNDFQVNQFSAGNQQAPTIAIDAGGAFTIAWQSAGQDSSGDAVVARRYNRDGVALANEFVVNQVTAGNQSAPSIAANPDGSWVVAWQSALQDGNGDAIVARRYDAAGNPLANEFIVNQFTTGNQSNPAIALHPSAGFVIAWQSAGQDGNLDGVVARTYSSAGVALGSEFVVNTVTTGAQNNPAVAIDADGDFSVAWQSPGQETGGGTSLGTFLRRYNVANDAPVMAQLSNRAIDVGGTVTFTAQAKDADGSLDTLTYSLAPGAPSGVSIQPTTGLVTWNTSTGVNAGRYFVTVIATDLAGATDAKDVAITLFAPGERTPLDDFVNNLDPAYGWDIRNRIDGDGFTKYNIRLTSGTWRTSAEVNLPLWQHWLVLYVPDVVRDSRAFLFIDGGSASSTPPTTEIDTYAGPISAATGMVLADLLSVPNQPLTFAGESFSRSEDSIIAYSWRKYLETGDPTWPVNLPMTRAAMRAMDAVTDFMGAPVGGNVDIESFVVSGASKRGWTTWLASATDPRVSYAIPVVADLLNMETSFVHHYAYYNGTFSVAVRDYVNEGILNIDNFGKDGINSLLSIVDPFTYKDRLTLPKYIINASGDEFFVPDSWKFYYDQLPGPKAIRYIPNTGHGISDPTVLIDAFTLLVGVSFGYQIPEYSFTQLPDGTIELQTSSPVVDARLFQATNPNAREFRFAAVGGIFTSTNLVDQGGGVYRANVPTPAQGWTAYLIQVSFPIPTGGWATVSSGVYFKGPPVNQQPIISPTPDITVGEGSFSIPVIATDPDQGQTLTYSLDPGAPAGVSINPTTGVITGFSNDQLGLLAPVTVVVSDNGSPVVRFRDSFRITVVNANPTAGLVGASSAVRGEVVPFTFSATDPSPIDQASNFTYEIDWDGDGLVDVTQVAGASLNLTHAFANTGSYTVRARVTDKDGGSSVWATQPVAVTRSRTAPNPLNSSLTDLFIGGLATDDFIIAGNAQNIDPLLPAGSIFYFNGNALSEGLETFTGITGQVVVYLQGGDDIFNPTDISVGTKQFGGSGNDVLFGSIASDTLDGGDGDDVLVGSLDPSTVGDLLLGGANADVILAADGNDTINGGSGEDLILGGDGNNVIDGGADNDVVIGGAGNDSLLGSQGSDFIVGGLGADTIFGGTGQDLIIAGVIDPNQELSETVLFEWWSAGTYTNRVNHLLGNQPGGLNSQNLTPGDNVLDDLSADQVFGEADEDFFFVNLALDATPDLVVGEIRAPL